MSKCSLDKDDGKLFHYKGAAVMSYELVKSHLNLYAVLQNLEELTVMDKEMAELTRDWNISIQFSVKGGPKAYIAFKDGKCSVGQGKFKRPSIKLFFFSPEHCNKMFDGNGNPIPLKGFTKLGFLMKDFPRLTDRLEYYMKPTDELLKKKSFLAVNTKMTIDTAFYATKELLQHDELGQIVAHKLDDCVMMMKVLPDGPAVQMEVSNGDYNIMKSEEKKATSVMLFSDMTVANDLLNGKIDAFSAIASGAIQMRGRIQYLDALGPVLDRISHYLS